MALRTFGKHSIQRPHSFLYTHTRAEDHLGGGGGCGKHPPRIMCPSIHLSFCESFANHWRMCWYPQKSPSCQYHRSPFLLFLFSHCLIWWNTRVFAVCVLVCIRHAFPSIRSGRQHYARTLAYTQYLMREPGGINAILRLLNSSALQLSFSCLCAVNVSIWFIYSRLCNVQEIGKRFGLGQRVRPHPPSIFCNKMIFIWYDYYWIWFLSV